MEGVPNVKKVTVHTLLERLYTSLGTCNDRNRAQAIRGELEGIRADLRQL